MVFNQLGIPKWTFWKILQQTDQILSASIPILSHSHLCIWSFPQRRFVPRLQLSKYFQSFSQATIARKEEQCATKVQNFGFDIDIFPSVASRTPLRYRLRNENHFHLEQTSHLRSREECDRETTQPQCSTSENKYSFRKLHTIFSHCPSSRSSDEFEKLFTQEENGFSTDIPSRSSLRQQDTRLLSGSGTEAPYSSSRHERTSNETSEAPCRTNRNMFMQEITKWRRYPGFCEGLRELEELDNFKVFDKTFGRRWLTTYAKLFKEARSFTSSKGTVQCTPEDEDEPKKGKKSMTNLKKEKERSQEDCDQAVKELKSITAKVKQVQETSKKSEIWLVRIRNGLSRVGPAIKAVASMSRQDWATKIAGWKKAFWLELQHYWIGSKLLWADVKISSRLLLKLAGGTNLTRRERQQLTRTTADIFRLVPFAVIVIVPFMEFLLPVLLKMFPNMLPSTFKDKMKEEEQMKKKLNARIEYAKFLQNTVAEMAKELKTSQSGDLRRTAEDLDGFMNKVRTGGTVGNNELLAFAKLFNDELTLDNISRPRLVSMCKYMNIQPYGTDAYLRYSLRHKLKWIKQDDKMIQNEGLDSLSEAELRAACRERGMLGLRSVEQMRIQATDATIFLFVYMVALLYEQTMQKTLRDWLDLSLNYSVPSSLLILSRSFMVAGRTGPEDVVQATLSSLPEEVIQSVGVTAPLPAEDALEAQKRKLEFLQQQEDLIKEEEKGKEVKLDKLVMAKVSHQLDPAIYNTVLASAPESEHLAKPITLENANELNKIGGALAVLASASSVSKERGEFLQLVKNEVELHNVMAEKEGTAEAEGVQKANQTWRENTPTNTDTRSLTPYQSSSALIERVDHMLQKLEKELDDVDNKIGDRLQILDRDSNGKVTPEEVESAAMLLKDNVDTDKMQELIRNLQKDSDGKILVEEILKLGDGAGAGAADKKLRSDNQDKPEPKPQPLEKVF